MPGTYDFVGGFVRLTLVNQTSLGEVEQLVEEALADPRCPPIVSGVMDLRRSTSVPKRSADEIAAGVHIFGARRDRFRRLAVLSTYGDRFAVTRTAESFGGREGLEVAVFTEEATADEWLREGEVE